MHPAKIEFPEQERILLANELHVDGGSRLPQPFGPIPTDCGIAAPLQLSELVL